MKTKANTHLINLLTQILDAYEKQDVSGDVIRLKALAVEEIKRTCPASLSDVTATVLLEQTLALLSIRE